MSKIKCPQCGYTEDDARPHDRETYYEVCTRCAPKDEGPTGLAAFYSARSAS